MIIKRKDSMTDAQQELEGLLQLPLNTKQRFLVERELKIMKAGERGEQDSAYFLDFAYGNSPNWAIIHDLRIEWKGRVAQIDHLIINRHLETYVLETKNFFYGVKISEAGEFNVWNGKGYIGIESPIEQNKRHIAVLEDRVVDSSIVPKRLGIPIPVKYVPYVLMSPKSKIMRPDKKTYETDSVIKADMFKSLMDKTFDDANPQLVLTRLAKMVSPETVEEFARGIASFHRPKAMNYRAKFGIPEDMVPNQKINVKTPEESAGPVEKTELSVKSPNCGKCKGKNIQVAYGKYGYYIKCTDCDQNTAIKEFCTSCNEKERIRKDKNHFYLECAQCKSSSLYHKNL